MTVTQAAGSYGLVERIACGLVLCTYRSFSTSERSALRIAKSGSFMPTVSPSTSKGPKPEPLMVSA